MLLVLWAVPPGESEKHVLCDMSACDRSGKDSRSQLAVPLLPHRVTRISQTLHSSVSRSNRKSKLCHYLITGVSLGVVGCLGADDWINAP